MAIVAPMLGEYLARSEAERNEAWQMRRDGARFSISGTLGCHRARCLDALGSPATPASQTAMIAFEIGTAYHELVQSAALFCAPYRKGCGWKDEVVVTPDGHDLIGHADLVLYEEDLPTLVVEIKTMQPFAFELATGSRRQAPQGPKPEHVLQAAMYAHGLGCAAFVLVYINKGNGHMVEYPMTLDQAWPEGGTVREQVLHELHEIDDLADMLDRGQLPERFVPGYGVVHVLPAPTSREDPWQCRLCRHRALCSTLGSGPVRVPSSLVAV